MSNIKLSRLPVTLMQAEYGSSVESATGNPLIEAIPPRLEPKQFRERLTNKVKSIDTTHLDMSNREAYANNLFYIRVLSRQHLELYYEMYSLLRQGYVHRNPLDLETVARDYDFADPDIPQSAISLSGPSVSEALLLTGFSGNGKTTMTEHILYKLFPRVIEHKLKGFTDLQVLYLKVDMPHDAVRSGLIFNVLEELDYVLSKTSYGDPRYRDSVKKRDGSFITIQKMKDVMLNACNRHHVGLIVLDEFQNIKVVSPTQREGVIRLVDELSNQLFIPFVRIGTPDLLPLFKNAVHKRRLGKPIELNRLNGAKEWSSLMGALYDFQPLAHPIARDEKIDAAMLSYTGAVPAYALGLWKEAIIRAIRLREEKITLKLLRQAFNERFPLLKSVVRNINNNRRGSYADLLTVQQYLDDRKSGLALRHLETIVEKSDARGQAASDILDGIEAAFEYGDLNERHHKNLLDMKKRLVEKSQAKLGPQTIEHKKK